MEQAPIIKQMPIELANKIAAGEVVQRPASAVKELLENAIDAAASEISVLIKSSGSSLIQVRDNGTGMSPKDAVQCFYRHATSKIVKSEDLEHIQTLGFRGEALASIAAIAQVSLKTKLQEDLQGTQVRIEGGQIIETSPCAAATGTTIDVRNLFFNVPARRSFLKAPSTEFRHISDVFIAQALAHPWTTFKLEHDDQDIYHLLSSKAENFLDALRERIRSILGSELAQYIVQVDESTSYISARGFLAHPEHARKSRKNQHLFVNGRPIRSPSLNHAIRSAYELILPEDRQPVYALFLTLNPEHVDVNVHPSKTEVRFDDDRGVYNFLQSVCKKTLGISELIPQHPGGVSSLSFQQERGVVHDSWKPPPRAEELPPVHGQQTAIVYELEPSRLPDGADPKPTGFLWQLKQSYILTQLNNGILVVDQHSAHQRILYEHALEDLQSGEGLSQQLLFPELLCLTEQDCDLLRELYPLAIALGFDYSISENRTVSIRGLPAHIRTGVEKEFLKSVLESYKQNLESFATSPLTVEENMARSIATHGALRKGVELTEQEMRTLIDNLFQCQDPYRTPGGNPTITTITFDELKRRFSQPLADYEQLD